MAQRRVQIEGQSLSADATTGALGVDSGSPANPQPVSMWGQALAVDPTTGRLLVDDASASAPGSVTSSMLATGAAAQNEQFGLPVVAPPAIGSAITTPGEYHIEGATLKLLDGTNAPFWYANGVNGLKIAAAGAVLDYNKGGQSAKFTNWSYYLPPNHPYNPATGFNWEALVLCNCSNVDVGGTSGQNMVFTDSTGGVKPGSPATNPTGRVIRVMGGQNVRLHDITINKDLTTDATHEVGAGISINGPLTNLTVERITISTQDDGIALQPEWLGGWQPWQGPMTNILVTDITGAGIGGAASPGNLLKLIGTPGIPIRSIFATNFKGACLAAAISVQDDLAPPLITNVSTVSGHIRITAGSTASGNHGYLNSNAIQLSGFTGNNAVLNGYFTVADVVDTGTWPAGTHTFTLKTLDASAYITPPSSYAALNGNEMVFSGVGGETSWSTDIVLEAQGINVAADGGLVEFDSNNTNSTLLLSGSTQASANGACVIVKNPCAAPAAVTVDHCSLPTTGATANTNFIQIGGSTPPYPSVGTATLQNCSQTFVDGTRGGRGIYCLGHGTTNEAIIANVVMTNGLNLFFSAATHSVGTIIVHDCFIYGTPLTYSAGNLIESNSPATTTVQIGTCVLGTSGAPLPAACTEIHFGATTALTSLVGLTSSTVGDLTMYGGINLLQVDRCTAWPATVNFGAVTVKSAVNGQGFGVFQPPLGTVGVPKTYTLNFASFSFDGSVAGSNGAMGMIYNDANTTVVINITTLLVPNGVTLGAGPYKFYCHTTGKLTVNVNGSPVAALVAGGL